MKIMNLSQDQVREQALKKFSPRFVQVESGSLFLRACADGTYRCDLMEETLFVSTSLGYHEVVIKGNKTRVKVEITLVFVKDNPYATIVDGNACGYVAIEEQEEIQFMEYPNFLEWILNHVHPIV